MTLLQAAALRERWKQRALLHHVNIGTWNWRGWPSAIRRTTTTVWCAVNMLSAITTISF